MAVLIVAGKVCTASDLKRAARLVTFAYPLGPITMLCFCAPDEENDWRDLSALEGIEALWLAHDSFGSECLVEPCAQRIADLAGSFTHLVAAAEPFGSAVMAGVAARLDTMILPNVVGIAGERMIEQSIYAGAVVQQIRSRDEKLVLTVRDTRFKPALHGNNRADITSLKPWVTGCRHAQPGACADEDVTTGSRCSDLLSARTVVAGGRALGSRKNFRLIEDLAAAMNGAVGATRAAVDLGYAPIACQIGQSGKVVAPDIYIAVGISGAIQHLVGMKDAKTVVAINRDPGAPIMQVADLVLEADLFDAVPQLIQRFEGQNRV